MPAPIEASLTETSGKTSILRVGRGRIAASAGKNGCAQFWLRQSRAGANVSRHLAEKTTVMLAACLIVGILFTVVALVWVLRPTFADILRD